VFGEVECRSAGDLCQKYEAGNGGWPTVVAFHAGAPEGERFPRKAAGAVCDEIVAPGRFDEYVGATLDAARAAAGSGGGSGGGEL
jgi:hypothetical protein